MLKLESFSLQMMLCSSWSTPLLFVAPSPTFCLLALQVFFKTLLCLQNMFSFLPLRFLLPFFLIQKLNLRLLKDHFNSLKPKSMWSDVVFCPTGARKLLILCHSFENIWRLLEFQLHFSPVLSFRIWTWAQQDALINSWLHPELLTSCKQSSRRRPSMDFCLYFRRRRGSDSWWRRTRLFVQMSQEFIAFTYHQNSHVVEVLVSDVT